MPDAPSTDSTMPTETSQASATVATAATTTDRAEALAARVRAMDAEVRAIEAEALALSAEAEAGAAASDGGTVHVAGANPSVSAAVGPVGPDGAAPTEPVAWSVAPSEPPTAAPETANGQSPAPGAVTSDPADASGDGLQRREFVRRVTSDAVVMAGKFYSISRVITRSATAAGQAVIADLESIRRDQDPEAEPAPAVEAAPPDEAAPIDTEPAAEEPASVSVPVAAPPPAEPVTPATPPSPVPLNLTPEQESLLDRVRMATLGVNRAGLSPHLTPAQFHWDGVVIRIPALGWASRTTNVRREPLATLFVEDPATGEFGAISGMTSIVERRSSVREQNDGLLQRYYPDVDAEEQWTKLLAEDPDRVLLVLQPVQTIWGRRA